MTGSAIFAVLTLVNILRGMARETIAGSILENPGDMTGFTFHVDV